MRATTMISTFQYAMIVLTLVANMHFVRAMKVDTFELSDLLSGKRLGDLKTVLTSTGLLAVHSPEFSTSCALEILCRCKDNLWQLDDGKKLRNDMTEGRTVMQDGVTIRNTLATATIGTTPLPLPDNLSTVCNGEGPDELESLRDQVAKASNAFVQALDRLLYQSTSTSPSSTSTLSLLRNQHGGTYSSVASIVKAAVHLEHFHVYSKTNHDIKDDDAALDLHTDAGLFLAFVPGYRCDGGEDSAFYVNGSPVAFPPNSIAIMLGTGAEHWLQTDLQLRATHHTVKMRPGHRAWYGMMHLIPESAIVQTNPDISFGDMRQAMAISEGTSDVFIGCGNAPPASVPTRRRHLSMVNGASACNNSTNFYCWMSCLSIPLADKAKEYLDTGNSLYCLDTSLLADTGNNVSKAVVPCLDGAMNPSCMGSWQPTVSGVIAQKVLVQIDNTPAPSSSTASNSTPSNSSPSNFTPSESTTSESTPLKPFCYGGTSMYMDGFHWIDSTCVIYLFSSWVLTTPAKLVLASFGTIFFGMTLELVIQCRRFLMAKMSAGRTRLVASGFFYGLQLTMGYFIMLIVMTYSGPLFFSVIVGLIGGHLLFNAQDAVFGKIISKEEMKSDQVFEDKTKYGSLEDDIPEMPVFKPKDENKSTIAEGFTPCCQNEL